MTSQVQEMFASIAGRYDWANDVLSMGIHRLWRRSAVAALELRPNMSVLDLCTGTGDLAFALARALPSGGRVLGLDFVKPMLDVAMLKKANRSSEFARAACPNLEFACGDAMLLPLADREVDIVSIGFGIRNVASPLGCLKEISRVLKPGGQVLILEFGQPDIPLFGSLYRLYSDKILPWVGGLATGNASAYHYLNRTSRVFPAGKAFLCLLEEAGFAAPRAKPLLGGLAYIYTGILGSLEASAEDNSQERYAGSSA